MKKLEKYEYYVEQGREPIEKICEGYQASVKTKHFDKILTYANCLIALGRFDEAKDFIYPLLSTPMINFDDETRNNQGQLALSAFRMEYELVVRSLANNHSKKQLQREVDMALHSIESLVRLRHPKVKELIYHDILLRILNGDDISDYLEVPKYKFFAKQMTEYDPERTFKFIATRNLSFCEINEVLMKKGNPESLKAQFHFKTDALQSLFDEVSERVSLIPRCEVVDPLTDSSLIAYDTYEFDLDDCGFCQGGTANHLRAKVAPGTDNVCDLYPVPYIKQLRLEECRGQYTLTPRR